jgi:hypothetical protein
MNAIHFAGADFFLGGAELSPELREALADCACPGQDASDAVAYARRAFSITGDPADCKAYLSGIGAWEESELSDHDSNLDKLTWLAACDLSESELIYFATY